jgi:FtsZ-binding cell division protein ZapB
MPLSLAQAASEVGCNRSTLFRQIKSGKISGSRDDNGQWWVEPSELFRVMPPKPTPVAPPDVPDDANQHGAKDMHNSALEAQIEGLKEVAALLRAQLADAQSQRADALSQRADALSQRDKWQEAFQEQRDALRALPSPHQSATPESVQQQVVKPRRGTLYASIVVVGVLIVASGLVAIWKPVQLQYLTTLVDGYVRR